MMEERYGLAVGRLQEIVSEKVIEEPFGTYFYTVAEYLLQMVGLYREVQTGQLGKDSLEALQKRNLRIYEDVLPAAYTHSYANPAYAVRELGEAFGCLFSFLYTEMRSLIVYAYEQKLCEMTIRMELFLEVYHVFFYEEEEIHALPQYDTVKEIVYWFVSDYTELEMETRIREQVNPKEDFALSLMQNSDLKDVNYLYAYGEYVTDNELATARHLQEMPELEIEKLADTCTEGFRMGFVNGNKDLSKKKVVNVRYCLGFERMVLKIIDNLAEMGLQPTIYRASPSVFHKRGNHKIGYYGAIANKQYEYDHKEDEALFLDKRLVHRKLEILKETYEKEKELASVFAGPMCIEVFGEEPFAPINCLEASKLTEAQQKLSVEYASESGRIVNDFIKGEERSFMIIAFPTPSIGRDFKDIFDEVVKINTLPYKKYEKMQQAIIDILDKADYVIIKGYQGNKTDLKVSLQKLQNPQKETIFENCVADVNIPVGEVFTSPRLKGTSGTLHVTRVFLDELEYKDLEISFSDGMISAYTCTNFEAESENKSYIKDNVLFHHDTLPMGEFAIGTNTTAYVTAQKYKIADRLPILIAEKMGPHFAVGDTCYSHSEELKVYNPDGKEIIAKDNDISSLRHDEKQKKKAYYNCHTDITIPYDELQLITAVTADGVELPIIKNGRFLPAECQELNLPFTSMSQS